jgi:hypothetical protein
MMEFFAHHIQHGSLTRTPGPGDSKNHPICRIRAGHQLSPSFGQWETTKLITAAINGSVTRVFVQHPTMIRGGFVVAAHLTLFSEGSEQHDLSQPDPRRSTQLLLTMPTMSDRVTILSDDRHVRRRNLASRPRGHVQHESAAVAPDGVGGFWCRSSPKNPPEKRYYCLEGGHRSGLRPSLSARCLAADRLLQERL